MNKHRKVSLRLRIGYLLAIPLAMATAPVAAAADGDASTWPLSDEHCVVEVVGQAVDGELLLSEPTCFDTLAESMASVGLKMKESSTPSDLNAAAMSSSSIIAVHYAFKNYGGSSLAVSGSSCTGGYINFRTAYTNWNNRMWSTINGCGGRPITHWDIAPASGGNCSGAKYVAWSSVPDLGAMGGNTSCVYYGP